MTMYNSNSNKKKQPQNTGEALKQIAIKQPKRIEKELFPTASKNKKARQNEQEDYPGTRPIIDNDNPDKSKFIGK